MKGNRKAAMAVITELLNELIPGAPGIAVLEAQLNALSDQAFDEYMTKLETGEEILPLVVPNLQKPKLNQERMFKLAKKLNHNFFQRLWLTDKTTGRTYLTPVEYLVLELPVRRQQQLLVKKYSIPPNNRSIDELTGQPTGDSKGGAISFPELQVLNAQNLDRTIEEYMKVRGGDIKAMRAMTKQLTDTGAASLDAIAQLGTRVRSTEILSTLLSAIHIRNNL